MLGFEVYFLWVLALIWIIFAVVEDLRTTEISDWLNLSLLIFALAFRLFYSLFQSGNMSFFYQGLIGAGIFMVLGNLFYYGKMFAGGDAKLFMSLGAILPIYSSFYLNVKIFFLFIFLFLIAGAVYGMVVSAYYGMRYRSLLKKEFSKQMKLNKNLLLVGLLFSSLLLLLGFVVPGFFAIGVFFFFISYFYIYVKSVDEACMIKKVKPSKLLEGDWLYKDVKVGKKVIRSTWDGLNKEDIKLLKKRKFVYVRTGIQFSPTFFLSFVFMAVILIFGLFGF